VIRLGLAFVLLLVGRAAVADPCAAPLELVQDDPRLPVTAKLLHKKQPLKILALGGLSTTGEAAGGSDKSWPARLELAMRERWPGVPITVVNKAVARQTAQEVVQRIETDVTPEHPSLVIWETGTTEAVRQLDLEEFASALEDGINRLKNHGYELMLMEMQFSRGTASVINFDRYLETLRKAADVADVYVFHRFDLMRYWTEEGVFSFVDVPKEKRAELAARVYDCVALRLTDAIAWATR
jgi:acyl-CoA thioesterase-1